ncbi:MAG: DUF2975 domain-containing protein [Aquaticitalea sp.]
MKRNILFKTLVDILFIFQAIGIIGLFFVMPLGVARINMVDIPVTEWTWISWVILLIGVIGYVIFVMGLFHLRKVARHLLSNKYFDLVVVKHLKKCGRYFVATGIFSFVVFIALWIVKLTISRISLYDSDVTLSLFMIMIGLFFIIQSEVILNAKNFKEDSELTI